MFWIKLKNRELMKDLAILKLEQTAQHLRLVDVEARARALVQTVGNQSDELRTLRRQTGFVASGEDTAEGARIAAEVRRRLIVNYERVVARALFDHLQGAKESEGE
jgi:hypothetical protein